jgi:hypothetical protein
MMSSRARVFSTHVLGLLLAALFALLGVASPEIASAAPLNRGLEYDRTADGEWAVAGCSRENGFRGAAHVYRRAGWRWILEAMLAPEERGACARFGASVAMSGNTLVIGAPWDEGWHGAAYVYERTGTTWRLAARLTPAGTVGDRFGTRVESADGIVSLASDAGAIVRFRHTGAAWTEVEHVPAGGATLAPARTADAALIEATTALAAESAALEPAKTIAIAAPDSVWASDGTFEDRTDVRWTPVSAGPLLYKIYRRLASDPPSANVLIRVASQEDVLFSDVTGTRGVTYTYCVSVLDMNDVEGTSRCDDGRRIIFAPTGFLASDATFEGYVRLQWSDRSSIEAGYRIRRDGALLRELDPDMTTFNDSTAVPGVAYLYELTAYDAAGSATAPLTDGGQSASIAAPLQVSATDGQFTDRVVITWVDPTLLETNYRVYRANGGPPTAG